MENNYFLAFLLLIPFYSYTITNSSPPSLILNLENKNDSEISSSISISINGITKNSSLLTLSPGEEKTIYYSLEPGTLEIEIDGEKIKEQIGVAKKDHFEQIIILLIALTVFTYFTYSLIMKIKAKK